MKPLLSSKIDSINTLSKLSFKDDYYICSPKIDGIRCLIHPTLGPVTRSLKPIPNVYIRKRLNREEFHGFDGEITAGGMFNETSSSVMSHTGKPYFTYWIFDDFTNPRDYYVTRFRGLDKRFDDAWKPCDIYVHSYKLCYTIEEIETYIQECFDDLFEGVMIRSPKGLYKFGRSTFKEEILIKYKRVDEADGTIVGFTEQMHNDNPAEIGELGQTKRAKCQEFMVNNNTLGALMVITDEWGVLSIGSGFDNALREKIWNNKEQYIGKIVEFKYQELGTIDKPRFPIFVKFKE
jgi:DNA ligase 1